MTVTHKMTKLLTEITSLYIEVIIYFACLKPYVKPITIVFNELSGVIADTDICLIFVIFILLSDVENTESAPIFSKGLFNFRM